MVPPFVSFIFILCISIIGAQEICTTPNGEVARCVDIHSCSIFLQALNSADDTSRNFLRASVCPGKSPLVVCCGSHTTYKRLDDSSSLLPGRDSCGFQDDVNKVFGGTDTGIIEYPWTAALRYREPLGHLSFKCGGTLISSKYVLTAAHCVKNPKLTLVSVRLGDWNLDSPEDCVGTASYKQCIPKPIDVEVEDIITHEKFSMSPGGVFFDIALLRLKSSVSYSSSIRPICLPKPQEKSSSDDIVYVAGWGNTEYSRYSPIKQKVALPIMDPKKCQDLFGRSGVTVNNDHVCAGGEHLKDSCKGDSGGPLMATVKENPNQFYLEGIVSVGPKLCGTQGVPGIYTRVNKYLDWIKSKITP